MVDRSDVSEADLLRAFAHLAESELDAAALAVGFERQATQKAKPSPEQTRKPRNTRRVAKPEPLPPVPKKESDASPWFWRLASDLPSPQNIEAAPDWLRAQVPIDDHSIEELAPSALLPLPLASAHRLARFIRQRLAVAMRSGEPDTRAAISRISRGEALSDFPALLRHRWPSGVHLVVDASSDLWPVACDFGVLARELERLLGLRLHVYQCRGIPSRLVGPDMRAATLPSDAAPVVVLSDAGMLSPQHSHQQAWVSWGLKQQRAGRCALLLAPVEPMTITRPMSEAFDVVALGREAGLRLSVGVSHHDFEAGEASGAASEDLPAPEALLRDLLYGNTYVEASLLRRLRRLLQTHGYPLSVESELRVWGHTSVESDPGGCTLQPSARESVRLRLMSVDAALLHEALALHWEVLSQESPLLRAEFSQWWWALLRDRGETGLWLSILEQGVADGGSLMRRVAAGLWSPSAQEMGGVADYLRRFGRRSPGLLAGSEAHQLAWTLAERSAIVDGVTRVPSTVDLLTVGWVLGNAADAEPRWLRLQADTREPQPGRIRLQWVRDKPATGSALDRDVAVSPLWSATFAPNSRQRALRWMRAVHELCLLGVQTAGASLVADMFDRWERSAALTKGGLGRATHFFDEAARSRPHPDPDAVQEYELPFDKDRLDELRQTRNSLAEQLMQADLSDLTLERLSIEFSAWLRAFRAVDSTPPFSAEGFPDFLAQCLVPSEAVWIRERVDQQCPPRRHVQRESAVVIDPRNTCTVSLPERTLVWEAIQRPRWAESIWCEDGHLMVEVADGQRLQWFPATSWPWNRVDKENLFTSESGYWWDIEAAREFAGDGRLGFSPPVWAPRHGIDAQGYWAEFDVPADTGVVTQRMRFIPPGEFWMGSPIAEAERGDNETLHSVTLTQGYWLADTACTQALWQAVMGENPSRFTGDPDQPVEQVSWLDITERFLPALNAKVPGLNLTLPTEAQWEYACRAGTTTPFSFGDQIEPAQVNYDGTYAYAEGDMGEIRETTVPVKSLPANPWGLYEMHGNVSEHCQDRYGNYSALEELNPTGAQAGAKRVLRGGCFIVDACYCRSASRDGSNIDERDEFSGFRLARGQPVASRAEPGGRGAPVLGALPTESAGGADAPSDLARGVRKARRKASRPSSRREAK